MSNRRRQNIRTMDPEDATVGHSGSVDDTLAEEYQNIRPAGPDDVPTDVGAVVGEEEVMLVLL